ncbi:uncharacterized protein LOC122374960 [Amphibalanus amphitrite]|uniref:uncharacterized protein LOC122374960 n=1 Tax=Amphibalanus amphitrite TaxID=1232801 RepID=UPI001C901E04|nr:uncharacterized protein LOC122374960 [Amphibalanus amphitrite]
MAARRCCTGPLPLLLLGLLLWVRLCHGAAWTRPATVHPGREGECYVSEDDVDVPGGIYLKPGQDYYRSPAACEVFKCRESSRGLELSFYSCGVLIPSEGCTLVSNDTVNYPHCCPEIRC